MESDPRRRDIEILVRRANTLQGIKKSMKQSEYKRQMSDIEKQLRELRGEPAPIKDKKFPEGKLKWGWGRAMDNIPDAAVYTTKGIDFTVQLSDEQIEAFQKATKELQKSLEQDLGEYFKYGPTSVTGSPFGFGGVADKVWKDHNGVILCECDNTDCDRIIPIGHDEYIKACGRGGYYRLTLADCPYGCLGYQLSERGKHWSVWAK